MKAEELRIGNLVAVGAHMMRVDALTNNIIQCIRIGGALPIPYRLEVISPIPLTAEILVKMGFDTTCDNDFRIGLPTGDGVDLCIELIDGNCLLIKDEINNGIKTGSFDFCYFKGVKYVHEAQNLFYALCKQELTITENKKGEV